MNATAAETQFLIEMMNDALAIHATEGGLPQAIVDRYTTEVARLRTGGSAGQTTVVEAERDLDRDRPAGGKDHRNQFGACKVRTASPKQVAFVNRLISERTIPALGGEQMALKAHRAGTANLRQTSDLIEWLMTLPEVATATPAAQRMASDKQQAFIANLLADKAHPYGYLDPATVTADAASDLINSLLALPKATTAPTTPLESGIYAVDTEVYKVYWNQTRTRMLAKVLVVTPGYTGFQYRGMADRFVKSSQRMTLEQAREFGAIYGVCAACGRTLTDETSIERGIGPVCAGKFA